MNAIKRLVVTAGVAALVVTAAGPVALAQDGFDDGSLKGVYALYSTDSSRLALVGVVEFDAAGGITAGNTTLVLLDPEGDPPVQAIPVIFDSGTYEVFADGTGTMTSVATAPGIGELANSWELVITQARKDDGIAEDVRLVMGELYLPDPENLVPLAPLLGPEGDPGVPAAVVNGDYAINPDGTGTMSVVAEAPGLGEFENSWALVITQAKKDSGVAEEVRTVQLQLDVTGELGLGFFVKLPIKIIPSLDSVR